MSVVSMPQPDAVFFAGAGPRQFPERATGSAQAGCWQVPGATLTTDPTADGGLVIALAGPDRGIERIALRWHAQVPSDVLVLGDGWERSYGDLGFGSIRPERVLPWYAVMVRAGSGRGIGIGVEVRPAAFASWMLDEDGLTLWLDVSAGNRPLELGTRRLQIATVRAVENSGGEPVGQQAFALQRELCAALNPEPPTPIEPLVGTNNWYYAYGKDFEADAVLRDAELICEAASNHPVRPFCVVDAGWTEGGCTPGGPWDRGRGTFADMAAFADRVRECGARPGLWFRPLASRVPVPGARATTLDDQWPLDPSDPRVLDRVASDVRRFVAWGFDLIKHDFSSYDAFGGFFRPAGMARPRTRWGFQDASRSSAEVLVEFYRTIQQASAGAVVIGCNTVGHLAAGLVQAQRVGDDTSGRDWERTRRMGINALAFRLAQHGSFFTVDPDCVAITPVTPWPANRQLLELVAASGAALFVSVDPQCRTPEVKAALRQSVQLALSGGARPGQIGVVPTDWLHTSAPRHWATPDAAIECDWSQPWGTSPLLDGH